MENYITNIINTTYGSIGTYHTTNHPPVIVQRPVYTIFRHVPFLVFLSQSGYFLHRLAQPISHIIITNAHLVYQCCPLSFFLSWLRNKKVDIWSPKISKCLIISADSSRHLWAMTSLDCFWVCISLPRRDFQHGFRKSLSGSKTNPG